MKTLRKYLSILLCLCVSTYTLPVFATTAAAKGDFVKVELSDTALDQAVGGSGSVDATMSDYKGGAASAVLANRSTVGCTYTLSTVNSNGAILETMVTGNLGAGQAILISGTPTDSSQKWVQARLWNTGVPGLEAKDSSWAP